MPGRTFSRGSRRKTQWAGFGDENGAVNLPPLVAATAGTAIIISQNLIIASSFGGLFDEETTITRTLGMLSAQMNVATANLQAEVAVGAYVARNEAVTVGVTALPDPEDDPDAEWLYYSSFQLRNNEEAFRDGPLAGIHIPFDVKGQRILRAGSVLVWIAKCITNNVRVGVTGRCLVKLA